MNEVGALRSNIHNKALKFYMHFLKKMCQTGEEPVRVRASQRDTFQPIVYGFTLEFCEHYQTHTDTYVEIRFKSLRAEKYCFRTTREQAGGGERGERLKN